MLNLNERDENIIVLRTYRHRHFPNYRHFPNHQRRLLLLPPPHYRGLENDFDGSVYDDMSCVTRNTLTVLAGKYVRIPPVILSFHDGTAAR
mmetsp:Transcript_31681/g.54018  ORF Transcript_31681/g.54018 Transcript_31681/m.54018 type:complete len:91 (+) Transcript_31681:833-1105(+)